MTRQIDADAVIRYLDFLDTVQTFHWVPPSMARAEALKQMRDFIEALAEPQPTFNEIERADPIHDYLDYIQGVHDSGHKAGQES